MLAIMQCATRHCCPGYGRGGSVNIYQAAAVSAKRLEALGPGAVQSSNRVSLILKMLLPEAERRIVSLTQLNMLLFNCSSSLFAAFFALHEH